MTEPLNGKEASSSSSASPESSPRRLVVRPKANVAAATLLIGGTLEKPKQQQQQPTSTIRRTVCKLMRRDIPIFMVALVIIFGFFNGAYNPFSSSLIADMSIPLQPLMEPTTTTTTIIKNQSAVGTVATTKKDIIQVEQSRLIATTTTITAAADATFHGQPVYYVDGSPKVSSVHCVGETFASEVVVNDKEGMAVVNASNSTSSTTTTTTSDIPTETSTPFVYRSCSFQNLCFDVRKKEFLLIASPTLSSQHAAAAAKVHPRFLQVYKSTHWGNNLTVSLGPIAQRWTDTERRFFEWFPNIVPQEEIQGYYQLDATAVLVPFTLHGASNPGHVLWDNFLPIYKLLTMFDLAWNNKNKNNNNNTTTTTNSNTPILMHVPITKYIFGACTRHQRVDCFKMVQRLLPLMGLPDHHFVSTKDARLKNTGATFRQSDVVCAKTGAAGLGMLSDHGTKEHGQYNRDYGFSHNVGKGELVFQYRNFILHNMGLLSPDRMQLPRRHAPYHITVATNSTADPKRLANFDPVTNAIQSAFTTDQVVVDTYIMKLLSLQEQVRIATESFFYLSVCGGSVMTATFLPRGASLVLLYSNTRYRKLPSFLDYDLLNNLPYIRVHWIFKDFINKPETAELLVLLIQQELDFLLL